MNGCFWCRAGTGPGCRGHGRNTIFLIIIKPTIELSLTKGGSAIISPNYEVVLVIFPHLFNPLKKMQLSRKIRDKKKKKKAFWRNRRYPIVFVLNLINWTIQLITLETEAYLRVVRKTTGREKKKKKCWEKSSVCINEVAVRWNAWMKFSIFSHVDDSAVIWKNNLQRGSLKRIIKIVKL